MDDLYDELVALFDEAARAHHQAHIQTDGVDPEWPQWYANYLMGKLRKLLQTSFTKSELVDLLIRLSQEQPREAPGADWKRYYARFFVENYTNSG